MYVDKISSTNLRQNSSYAPIEVVQMTSQTNSFNNDTVMKSDRI